MRILGIDLGSTSIKAVEIESTFGRLEIHDHYEQVIESGEDPMLAVSRLTESLHKKPDRIGIALPTRNVTFRNLQIPSRDRKEIQSTVGFELEDELPFSLEKIAYHYSTLSQSKQQGSEIYVAATLKTHVENTLAFWNGAGISPDLITAESWAYRALLNRIVPLADQDEPILLAHIGHQRTTLYIQWHGAPVFSREISWGSRDLNGATEVSEEITPQIRELISAFRQAEFTCKSMTHHSLGQIYLAGSTSLLPGLIPAIENTFSMPVRPLRSLSLLSLSVMSGTGGGNYSDHVDVSMALAASIALCLAGLDRTTVINFRTGEYSKKGVSREINFGTLKKPLIAASLILTSMMVSMTVQSKIMGEKIKNADTDLARELKTFFGAISNSAIHTYLSDPSTLKSNINKELKKQRELVKLANPNPNSPLNILKGVSATIPKDVTVDLVQFQAGTPPSASYLSTPDPMVQMTFQISNQEIADQLFELLEKKFNGLQKNKPEALTSADGIPSWKIIFSGKPAENAYGN